MDDKNIQSVDSLLATRNNSSWKEDMNNNNRFSWRDQSLDNKPYWVTPPHRAAMNDEESANFYTLIIAVVGLAFSIAGTLSSMKNQRLAGEYGKAISNLSYADQQILNEKILRATTQTERLAIIANAVANIKAAQTVQAAKNKNLTTILILTGAVGLIISAYLLKKS